MPCPANILGAMLPICLDHSPAALARAEPRKNGRHFCRPFEPLGQRRNLPAPATVKTTASVKTASAVEPASTVE
jgi:hypothetical protein